jgi:hypothetical protein
VELRPDDRYDATAGRFGWWAWRLEDMKWIGHGGLTRNDDGAFWVGASIWSGRGRYAGGYGSEIYRLICRFASAELRARKVLANNTDLERKAALEEAGFKLVDAFPAQHAKRRRGYGIRRYE